MNIKQKIGIIISNTVNKTKIVLVENKYVHHQYKKIVKKSKHYMIHDEKNISKLGDIVSIEECAPISKNKNWKLKEILKSI